MKPSSKLRRFLLLAGSTLLATSSAHAADGTWNGITGTWTDTTDPGGVWSGGTIADGADSTAYFTGVDIVADKTITLGVNRAIGNITFTDATTSSNNLTITGNTLTLDRTVGVPVVDVTQADRQLTLSSTIAGNDGLQKNGDGILTLTGANTFSGGLTINAGMLFGNANNSGVFGSGKITIGDVANTGKSTELLYSGGNKTFTNLIDVVGTGAASIRIVGFNPLFSGAVSLSNNLKVVSDNSGGSNLKFSGGVTGTGNLVIQSNAANILSSAITFQTNPLDFTGTITNSGTTTSATSSNTSISAVIGTAVTGITQNSTNSALILSGANTFTGNITISAGTLSANLGTSSANPTTSALGNPQTMGRTVTVSTGGTLNFNLGDVMGDGSSTPNLTLIANGGTIKNKAASTFFNVLGPVQLNGGTLGSFGGGSSTFPSFALTGTVTIGGSAVSTITSSGTNSQIGLQATGTTFAVADAVTGSDLNVTGVLADWNSVAGSLIKSGTGTMTLSGINTYTGATRIDNGTLALTGASGSIATSASVTIKAGATLDTTAKASYAIPTGKPVNFAVDGTGSGATGQITAAALDISNATVTYAITGPLDDAVYVLATYTPGSLTGTFLSSPAAPAGYTLDYAYEGDKIALVQNGGLDNFLSWATQNGVTGGETGDADHDGVENLIEYALVDGGERGVFSGNTITFSKRGAPYGSDLTYSIETSETLVSGSWTPAVTHGPALLGTNPTISYSFTPGTPVKNFARLKTTIP